MCMCWKEEEEGMCVCVCGRKRGRIKRLVCFEVGRVTVTYIERRAFDMKWFGLYKVTKQGGDAREYIFSFFYREGMVTFNNYYVDCVAPLGDVESR